MNWDLNIEYATPQQRKAIYRLQIMPKDRVKYVTKEQASELIRIGLEVYQQVHAYEGNESE
jgi:hypothetical protein